MNEPKILLFDIETMPDLQEVMKVYVGLSAYPGLTLKASITSIICIGYKWLGDKKTHCINAWDYPNWKKDINDDSRVIQDFRKVIEEADAIVTHNGTKFDLKHLKTRMMKHNIEALPKIQHIDTKNEAKKHLYLFNNKLDTLGKFLVGDKKLDNGGWDLWVDVMNREPKAQDLMEKYCKQDVNLLEKVFLKLRPYITTIPNHGLFQVGSYKICPKCGSTRVQNRGYYISTVAIHQKVWCRDCDGWSKGPRLKKDLILK